MDATAICRRATESGRAETRPMPGRQPLAALAGKNKSSLSEAKPIAAEAGFAGPAGLELSPVASCTFVHVKPSPASFSFPQPDHKM